MKILHVCNWCSGITTRNVVALKQFSKHNHELVTKIIHPLDMGCETTMLTEANTEKETVLQLAEEADVLHFHATGYSGTKALPQRIHDIDWSRFLNKKPFIAQGMVSLIENGKFTLGWILNDRFSLPNMDAYAGLMGPHLSCKITYQERLHYVPDILPINDWLYTPLLAPKQKIACTFKEPEAVEKAQGLHSLNIRMLPFPSKLAWQLEWRRRTCRATFDNSKDGHWGLFAMESLSQGIPCAAYTHEINKHCWKILNVPPPPLEDVAYGGSNLGPVLNRIMDMSEENWLVASQQCRWWVDTYYNPKRLVQRWDDVYGLILGE